MPYKCYSHPGKYLIDHLNNVKKIGLEVFDSKNLLKLPVDKEDYRKALEIALYYHDFGKSTEYFQKYLKCSIEKQQCPYEKRLTRHSLLSACFAAYKAYEQFKDKDIRLSCLVFSCILKHHGDLNNLSDMLVISNRDWDTLEKQWDNIISDDFNEEFPEFSKIKSLIYDELYEARDDVYWNIDWYCANNLMFSIVTYADKNDVIFEKSVNFKNDIDTNLVYIYKKKNFTIVNNINKIREEAYSLIENTFMLHLNNSIFSLNLPTGFGKTLIAINLALKTVENDSSIQRVIYALPFTSIVDQTADTVNKLCGKNAESIVNVHHHLAKLEVKISEDYIDADKAQFIIENWDKPFIVTTFWQIFYSLLSNENSILRKFHNVANSVIILDEIQTLPYKYWELVSYIFKKLTQVLNCKIILMTATMPAIFKSDEILDLVDSDSRKRFFKAFDRYSIEKIDIDEISLDKLLKIANKDILGSPDKDFMFIFNTIKSATKFFRELKKMYNINDNLFFLSSRVLPVDRCVVINKIKNTSKRKILVTTQLVEAGVDIDFDIVYRDFAPLDNIIQAAGRCNRNNKKPKGKVNIFRLKNESNKFDCDYIYKGLTLDRTLSILNKTEIFDESNLIDIIDEYYSEIKNNSSTNESKTLISNVEKLEYEHIKKNFNLIDEKPSFSVFIEKDEYASKILNRFEEIYEINDIFERKKRFLEIRSQFYQYVISLPKLSSDASYIRGSFDEIGPFKVVKKDSVQMLYKEDIGFSAELDDNFL
jgi:CRISPR-associated endonuclease/helicase Cas3